MTRNEYIKKDTEEIIEKLKGVDLNALYSPNNVIEILQTHGLDSGIAKYRPDEAITGHEIVEKLVEIYTIVGDAIHKNIGLYD